jgi:hypothetical protein
MLRTRLQKAQAGSGGSDDQVAVLERENQRLRDLVSTGGKAGAIGECAEVQWLHRLFSARHHGTGCCKPKQGVTPLSSRTSRPRVKVSARRPPPLPFWPCSLQSRLSMVPRGAGTCASTEHTPPPLFGHPPGSCGGRLCCLPSAAGCQPLAARYAAGPSATAGLPAQQCTDVASWGARW